MKLNALTLLTILSCLLPLPASAKTIWNMPLPYDYTTHQTQNTQLFAAAVESKTFNDLNIRVHPGGKLIKHLDIFPAVRNGQVALGEIFMGTLSDTNPLYAIDNIPFLVSNFDDARKLWAVTRPFVEQDLQSRGLKLLYAVPWPPQGFFTNTRITGINDFATMKIRTYSATTSRLSELLAASPVTVQTPDIAAAFGSGDIDAMITSPTTGVSEQAWSYTHYYLDSRAWIPKDMVFINAQIFQQLPDSMQIAILEAAAEAEQRGWQMAEQETNKKMDIMRRNGMVLYEPSADFTAQLAHIGQLMASEWIDKMGQTGRQIISALGR